MPAFAISSVKAVTLDQRCVAAGSIALLIPTSGISDVPNNVLTTPATDPP
jgi:hypothetical protein